MVLQAAQISKMAKNINNSEKTKVLQITDLKNQ